MFTHLMLAISAQQLIAVVTPKKTSSASKDRWGFSLLGGAICVFLAGPKKENFSRNTLGLPAVFPACACPAPVLPPLPFTPSSLWLPGGPCCGREAVPPPLLLEEFSMVEDELRCSPRGRRPRCTQLKRYTAWRRQVDVSPTTRYSHGLLYSAPDTSISVSTVPLTPSPLSATALLLVLVMVFDRGG